MPKAERKQLAEQALQGLHAAAETVRSCVEQHIECIRQVESELRDASATEPAIISNAAESIIAANGLVQHQFNDIQRMIDNRHGEIQDHLTDPYGLFFTFASLDRQRHVYRQVLSSLEMLAAELMGNIQNHGQRLKKITNGLEESEPKKVEDITAAVAQIFDATDEMQQKIESTEQHLGEQAEKVHMQAVLSHTDLLTSLPNRRAFEAEVEQLAARTHGNATLFHDHVPRPRQFQQDQFAVRPPGRRRDLAAGGGRGEATDARPRHGRPLRRRHVCARSCRRRRCTTRCRWPSGCGRRSSGPNSATATIRCGSPPAWASPSGKSEETPEELTQRADQSLQGGQQGRRQFVLLARRQGVLPGFVGLQADDATPNGSPQLVTMFRRKLTGEDGEEQVGRRKRRRRTTGRSSRAGRCSWPICSGDWRNGSGAGRWSRCSCCGSISRSS